MRFDSFIQALDMGQCEDQQQRQALFDLALFLIVADGVISQSEADFMHSWLGSLAWKSDISQDNYYSASLAKCQEAIADKSIEDFLAHRARLLVDKEMKEQAMKLVRDIAQLDGELDDSEGQAISILSGLLEK
jgi:tellurite resistance protein